MQYGADPQLEFTVAADRRDSVVVVQARGELDYTSAPILRGRLAEVWASPGVASLVLDLTEVSFCDSVGLSELISTLRRSEAEGVRLAVAGVQGTVLRVLTITGLRHAFDMCPTVEDALPAEAVSAAGADPPVAGRDADPLANH
ncbi:STAS domain-containing protein [Sphaerisporangium sp. TRM90804]|uniref:STAS domain-containing protein n=1 Tax=Sphaerisporangium sp. TRM90804 TaxID=3031113 RepID=UPI002448BEB6|nr:STAS domain-containing protein [Sphaerisporangium sp. TRM90804]MDH2424905.1 STAS domain-containing protein [Sphaerisporangium sp. TRM90804]